MTRPELMKALREKGILFTTSMKNVELEALLAHAEAKVIQETPPVEQETEKAAPTVEADAGTSEPVPANVQPPEESPVEYYRIKKKHFHAMVASLMMKRTNLYAGTAMIGRIQEMLEIKDYVEAQKVAGAMFDAARKGE